MSKETVRSVQEAVGTTPDGLWGPKTMAAVAAKLGCGATVREIQRAVGADVDGIIGPQTLSLIAARVVAAFGDPKASKGCVFLDPGHTRDYEREHPTQFSGVDWTSGNAADVLAILDMTTKTNDSIEHRLNVVLAEAVRRSLTSMGVSVVVYDDPALANDVEIGQVYRRSNALLPDVFLSIHNNAQGGAKWKSMGCTASGTVGLYNGSNSKNRLLARDLADAVNRYRKTTGGPNNRADLTKTSSVGVLANADRRIVASLLEVCFYDNLDDLYWTVTHIDGIASAIARVVAGYAGGTV